MRIIYNAKYLIAFTVQQSKIQCHSHHMSIRLLVQPIIKIPPPVKFESWITFRRQLSKYKGRGGGVCSKLPFASFFPFLFLAIRSNLYVCVCILSHCFREWANIYSERILWRNAESFSELWLPLPSPRSHFLPLCQIQATLSGCCTRKEEEASHLCTLPQNMVDNTVSPMIWPLCVSRQQEENISVLTKRHSMLHFSVLACHVEQEGAEVSPWLSLWSQSPPSGKWLVR